MILLDFTNERISSFNHISKLSRNAVILYRRLKAVFGFEHSICVEKSYFSGKYFVEKIWNKIQYFTILSKKINNTGSRMTTDILEEPFGMVLVWLVLLKWGSIELTEEYCC